MTNDILELLINWYNKLTGHTILVIYWYWYYKVVTDKFGYWWICGAAKLEACRQV